MDLINEGPTCQHKCLYSVSCKTYHRLTGRGVEPKLLPQWMYQVANLANQANYKAVRARLWIFSVETLVVGGRDLSVCGVLC